MKMLNLALASAASLALMACAEPADDTAAAADPAMAEDTMADTTTNADGGTVVEVAQGNPDFSTLVSAVTAADLGGTLSSTGPFTLFAPNNAAFEKVPQATRDQLMSPGGKADLTGILTYHVVQGETNAAALTEAIEAAGSAGYKLTTVTGGTLTATMEGGKVVLTDAAGNKATVTATDVEASNGVIHVIDTVLMPK